MALHHRTFTVRGRGEFPLDMLRYDTCWPRRGEDVHRIEPSYATGEGDLSKREVNLAMYTPIKRGPFTTWERWNSFGWQVIKED